MGKVLSLPKRAIQRFNVESRAQKILSQEKPKPAPLHKANVQELERLLKDSPDWLNKINLKDTALNDRLKQVYVSAEEKFDRYDSTRVLPNQRTTDEEDPAADEKAPPGRIKMKHFAEFLSARSNDIEVFGPEKLANDIKIDVKTAEDIIEHFRPLTLHVNAPGTRKLPEPEDQKLLEGKYK